MPLYHGKKVRLGHPSRATGPDARNHKRWEQQKLVLWDHAVQNLNPAIREYQKP